MNVGYDTATTQTEACIKKIMSNFSKPPTSYATSIPAKLPHLHESLAKRVNRFMLAHKKISGHELAQARLSIVAGALSWAPNAAAAGPERRICAIKSSCQINDFWGLYGKGISLVCLNACSVHIKDSKASCVLCHGCLDVSRRPTG